MSHIADRVALQYLVGSDLSVHIPAQVDDGLKALYRQAHTLKADMDRMAEIPDHLMAFYRQTMATAEAIRKATEESTQLREMARRLPR